MLSPHTCASRHLKTASEEKSDGSSDNGIVIGVRPTDVSAKETLITPRERSIAGLINAMRGCKAR